MNRIRAHVLCFVEGDKVGSDKLGDQRLFSDVVQRLDPPARLLQ